MACAKWGTAPSRGYNIRQSSICLAQMTRLLRSTRYRAAREFLQWQKMTYPLFRLCSASSLPQVLNKFLTDQSRKRTKSLDE